jgi:hypothetical protein
MSHNPAAGATQGHDRQAQTLCSNRQKIEINYRFT